MDAHEEARERKSAKAAVAVARKLAVLLHRLWVSGEVYEPLHHAKSATLAEGNEGNRSGEA